MNREFKISLSQECYSDVIYLSQYDDDYSIVLTVLNKYSLADISGYSYQLEGTRPDGLGFTLPGTVSGSKVTIPIDTTLTACAGASIAELVIYDGNGFRFGSANVQIIVEPAAHPDSVIDADEDTIRGLAAEVQEIVDTAADTVAASLVDVRAGLNDNLQNVSLLSNIIVSDIENGYYSVNNGQKYDNSLSTNYRRSKSLIRVEELTLYYANISCMACCYDAEKTFISSIYLDTASYKSRRKLTPANTAYVGLFVSGATGFTLTKVDREKFVNAEYPYVSDSYLHIENCWCAGTGSVSETENLDMLIVPVTAGEKYFISNNANYNCLCMDSEGELITATSENRTPTGKVYTVPTGAVQMYVNIYRNRTKGVNAEMSDYLAKITKGKVLAIGDSITWLDGRQNYGGMAYVTGWQRWLRLAGYDVVSAGFSGYPYATGLDVVDGVDYSIYKEIVTNTYSVSGYDYIIMFGGTNDVLHGGALGDRPTDYSNRTFDASKFNGAIGAIISYIRTNNGTAKILLASFPKSEAVSRSFPNAFSRVEEIRYNCEFWSCKYVPIFSEINVQPTYDQFDTFFYDATHPNFNGMERIGKLMLTAVENY